MPTKKEKQPLSITHPELAKEAVGWDPREIRYGSGKKLTWKCSKDHVYEATVNNRTNAESGCPFCSNQKVLTGFNDLEKISPKHSKFANGFEPKTILNGSYQVCNWICPHGHTWKEQVKAFVKRNPICKVCSGIELLTGFNDIKTIFPELAKQARGWDPSIVLPTSRKKLNWICECNHKWDASPANRTHKQTGCPYCKKGNFLLGFNDLFSTFPDIAKEASGWDPKEIHKGSNESLTWRCDYGHSYRAVVSKRTSRGDGCPICSNHKLLKGFNDLQTKFPEIAKEAHGWDPKEYRVTDRTRNLTWICKSEGHTWQSSIFQRTQNLRGCTVCNPSKSQKGKDALSISHPELAKQARGWDPRFFSSGSSAKKEWVCELGHLYSASIASRTTLETGCGVCGNKVVLSGFNDLQTKFPEIAKDVFEWDPSKIFPGSNKTKEWECKLGHIYKATPNSRTSKMTGCSYCSGHQVLIGFNDLLTVNPKVAIQAHQWDPRSVTGRSNKNRSWRCDEGHIWKASVASRTMSGCPYCSGGRVWPGFNDLLTTNPSLAKEAFGWNPIEYTNGSGVKVKWKCSEGHIWTAAIYSRSGGKQSGCPTCAKTGFDPNKDGYLYFITHPDWEMHQIGITNFPDDRLKDHKKLGWEILELRGPMDGYLTQQWETAILRMLKAKGADLSNSKIAGKFDGYSEAWSKSTFEAESIKELMRLTEKFEGS